MTQTEWYASRQKWVDHVSVHREVTADWELQRQLAKRHGTEPGEKPATGIVFPTELFNERQRQALENAKQFLLSDQELQKELNEKFGFSFQDINAVVVPGWQLHNSSNRMLVGLTEISWNALGDLPGDPNVPGFTLRDRDPRLLIAYDGRPRVVLNLAAFHSQNMLRWVLFHELLHAMNIPAHNPPKYVRLQSDLTYLPLYRSFIRKAGLGGWYEVWIWLLCVCAPWTIGLIVGLRTKFGKT
jgi:hypothetical protein